MKAVNYIHNFVIFLGVLLTLIIIAGSCKAQDTLRVSFYPRYTYKMRMVVPDSMLEYQTAWINKAKFSNDIKVIADSSEKLFAKPCDGLNIQTSKDSPLIWMPEQSLSQREKNILYKLKKVQPVLHGAEK